MESDFSKVEVDIHIKPDGSGSITWKDHEELVRLARMWDFNDIAQWSKEAAAGTLAPQ